MTTNDLFTLSLLELQMLVALGHERLTDLQIWMMEVAREESVGACDFVDLMEIQRHIMVCEHRIAQLEMHIRGRVARRIITLCEDAYAAPDHDLARSFEPFIEAIRTAHYETIC